MMALRPLVKIATGQKSTHLKHKNCRFVKSELAQNVKFLKASEKNPRANFNDLE